MTDYARDRFRFGRLVRLLLFLCLFRCRGLVTGTPLYNFMVYPWIARSIWKLQFLNCAFYPVMFSTSLLYRGPEAQGRSVDFCCFTVLWLNSLFTSIRTCSSVNCDLIMQSFSGQLPFLFLYS
ncbi:hypothetical protein OSB04_un001729 [Centaurea solstitialis]|uniref:Uncharacterized protein n=1 Tax=Centaurea solstitialis TaxID=347529 RepID=A0AA38W4S8_9ASTR|nr:hypothetical protein OSB04_un001729 [Centaurea solstitialis]